MFESHLPIGSSDLAAKSISTYHTEVGGGHRPVNQRRNNTNASSRANNSNLQTRPVTERQRVPGEYIYIILSAQTTHNT